MATPDAAATIVRGSVLLSSLPAMVPVGSAPPPAIGERLFVLVLTSAGTYVLVARYAVGAVGGRRRRARGGRFEFRG